MNSAKAPEVFKQTDILSLFSFYSMASAYCIPTIFPNFLAMTCVCYINVAHSFFRSEMLNRTEQNPNRQYVSLRTYLAQQMTVICLLTFLSFSSIHSYIDMFCVLDIQANTHVQFQFEEKPFVMKCVLEQVMPNQCICEFANLF